MRQINRVRESMVLLLTFVLLLVSANPASAATEYFSSLSGGCSSSYPAGSSVYGMRYKSTIASEITSISVIVGNNNTTGYESTTVLLFSDSATPNIPFKIIDTFTANSLIGSGVTTAIKYVGSHTVASGDKFWLAPNAPASLPSVCYKNILNTSTLVMNGIAVDTSTSVVNAYRATSTVPLRNSSSWSANQGQGFFQISIEGDPVVTDSSISVNLVAGGNKVTYRQQSGAALRADVSVEGKVTFYQNGKKISGCINISSSSLTATCTWKPSIHGATRITASLKPFNDRISPSTSTTFALSIVARTTTR